jgi:hypothetical protein
MLSVIFVPFSLSVIMLNVVMLSVVRLNVVASFLSGVEMEGKLSGPSVVKLFFV